MPTLEKSVVRRRVRCPKCTAILTEPEAKSETDRIYECSICSTLLVAGNRAGTQRSPKNRLPTDAEDVRQISEVGSKTDKEMLFHESNREQDMDSKAEESATAFNGRVSQSYLSYENSADPLPSSVEDASLSGMSPLWQKAAMVDNLVGHGMLAETPVSSNPHDRSSSHGSSANGELSDEGEAAGQGRFSEIESASRMGVSSLDNYAPNAVRSSGIGDSAFIHGADSERHWPPEEVLNAQIPGSEGADAGVPQIENAQGNSVLKDLAVGNITRTLDGENRTVEAENRRGKFRLFDLSVFGIYDEEAYLELSRGKDADHPKLVESSSNGGGGGGGGNGGGVVVSDEVTDECRSNINKQGDSRDDAHKEIGGDQGHPSQHEFTDSSENQMDGYGASGSGGAKRPTTDIDDLVTTSYEVEKHGARVSVDAGLTDINDLANSCRGVDKGGTTSLGDAGLPTRDIDDLPKTHHEVKNQGASSLEDAGFPPRDFDAPASAHDGAEKGGDSMEEDARALTLDNPASTGSEEQTCTAKGSEDARVPITDFNDLARVPTTEGLTDLDDLASSSHGEIVVEKNLIEFTLSDWQSQQIEVSSYGALEDYHVPRGGENSDTEDSADSSLDDDEGLNVSKALKEASEPGEAPLMEKVSLGTARSEEQSSLQRNAQETTLQSQISQNHIKAHYEAGSHGVLMMREPSGALKDSTENVQDIHLSRPSTVDDKAVCLSAVDQKGAAPSYARSVLREDQSSKEIELVKGVQKDASLGNVDTPFLQKEANPSRHLARHNVGNSSGKHGSLRLKGSLSSTEDEKAHGMWDPAVRGLERDHHMKQGDGLTEGSLLSSKESKNKLGQLPTSRYYEAVTSVSQQPWNSNVRLDGHNHRGVEMMDSHKPWNEGYVFPNTSGHEEVPYGHSDTHRLPHLPAPYHARNRSSSEKTLGYSYSAKMNFNGDHPDHPSLSHEDPSHTFHSERYLPNPYGLPGTGSVTRSQQFHVNGAVPPPTLPEPGFANSGHRCVSPTCAMCIQQQCYLQQPAMLHQNMMYPCAACASQPAGTAVYQSLHHPTHSQHMHPATYSNPSLGLSGSRPRSGRQNRSTMYHHNHPSVSASKMKRYPPLPGKGAAPYVLCKDCNQILKIPVDLPLRARPLLKLLCGACGKVSKFSVRLQDSDDDPVNFRPPIPASTMSVEHVQEFPRGDKRHKNTTSVHSSGQIASSHHGNGLSTPIQNMYGVSRYDSRQSSQHECVEGRMMPPPNVAANTSLEWDSPSPRYHGRPLPGGMPGQGLRRSHAEGRERLQGNNGLYGEDYLSSSPSSASGSSPVRYNQMIGHHLRRQPHTMGSSGVGDRKLSLDLPVRSTVYEESRPPFEAPGYLDDFYQNSISEGRSAFSLTNHQGSLHDPFDETPNSIEDMEMLQRGSKARNWHNQPSNDAQYLTNSTRSRLEQLQSVPAAAAGSPLIEHLIQDVQGSGPTVNNRHWLQASGNGSRFATQSSAQGSPCLDPSAYDTTTVDLDERSQERGRPPMPVQDVNKGQRFLGGLLKKSSGKGGQGGMNGRRVWVNGHLIREAAVHKAEELAGPVHAGSYWYDYQAGFWGVMGGPCLGILMPHIEEFNIPLSRDCAGGTTGIIVNGRELHEKDLEVLAKRGLPSSPGKAYVLGINGALIDDITGQPLKSLGKLAPSIEKKGCGFGMKPMAGPP